MMEHLEQVSGFDFTISDGRADYTVGPVDVDYMIARYRWMFMRHWDEVAVYKDVRPLDPDWRAYSAAGKKGQIVCFGAMSLVHKEIVAYSVYMISRSLHYRTWVSASNDIYYVAPTERRTPERWLARDFFRAADEWLKKEHHVRSIRYPVKAHLDHSAVFKELGYEKVEDIYERLT